MYTIGQSLKRVTTINAACYNYYFDTWQCWCEMYIRPYRWNQNWHERIKVEMAIIPCQDTAVTMLTILKHIKRYL